MKKIFVAVLSLLVLLMLPMLDVPVSANTPTSGACGESLTWSFDVQSNVLTISGTGPMQDYSQETRPPWYEISGGMDLRVVIDEGVTYIGDYAFYNMWNLIRVSFPSTVTEIGDYACTRTNLGELQLPENLVVIGEYAFQGLKENKSLVIPDSVEVIKDYAFESWYYAKEISISKNLKTVGAYAFSCWDAVEEMSFPDGITVIPNGLLSGNAALVNLRLPSYVVSIGDEALSNCISLRSLTLPKGVEHIGFNAFRGCMNMEKVIIPATLKTVDYGAFFRWENLKTVYFEGTQEQWDAISFAVDNEELLSANIQFGENPFGDIQSTDYFYDAVLWARRAGVTEGVSPNSFGPYAPCTRGQIVTFLWRAYGSAAPASQFAPFDDVCDGDYYRNAVLWAVERTITAGVGDRVFGPEQACTRAQVVTFLWRAAGCPKAVNSVNPFSDVSTDAYYYDAVLWAAEQGITGGVGEGRFGSDEVCTRGQIVTFLYKAMK